MELICKWQDLNPELFDFKVHGSFEHITFNKYLFVPSFKGDSDHIYKKS